MKINKNSLIIISSIPPELLLSVRFASIIKNYKTILDVRDVWPDSLIDNSTNHLLKKAFSFYCNVLYSITVKFSDETIIVTSQFKKWLERFENNLHYECVPLGFDSHRWDLCIKAEKLDTTIIYIGSLSSQWDLSVIIKGILSSSWHLTIIGDGPDFKRYKELSQESEQIKMLGFLPPAQATNIVLESSIGVIPLAIGSKAFLPNKIFDYLGAGIPVISFGGSDTADLINENDIGWIIERDDKCFSSFLNSLTTSIIQEKADNVNRIRDKFSKDTLYKKFIQIIKNQITK